MARSVLATPAARVVGTIVVLAAAVGIGRFVQHLRSGPPSVVVDDAGTDAERLLSEPETEELTRAAFAEDMAEAIRAAQPEARVSVDDDRFVITWEKGDARGEVHLDRSYREYAKLPASEREAYVARRAAKVVGAPLPATFAEADPAIVPLVRERIDYEIARIMASPKPLVELVPEPPHVALTDALWGVLAYETEDQFVRLDAAALARWKVSFDDAWRGALERLAARGTKTVPAETGGAAGGVREIAFGDGNDTARVLVPRTISLPALAGDAVFAMPKEDLLLVAGADDTAGLRMLAERLVVEWDRGAQNAHLLRIRDGKAAPFLVDASHPLHAKFADLQASADQRDEELQRDALKERLGEGEDAPFVASIKRVGNEKTHEEFAFVVHTEETPTVLPRADFVVFRRVDLTAKTATTLACGAWDTVFAMMKGRWKETPLRPARWLATELPTAEELKKLGCPHPLLRLDVGVARPVH